LFKKNTNVIFYEDVNIIKALGIVWRQDKQQVTGKKYKMMNFINFLNHFIIQLMQT